MRANRLLPLALATLIPALALAQDIVLPDGKAKKTVETVCADCHGLDTVVANGMSADQWRESVKTMVRRGAQLSPAEIDSVVDYLSVYFGADKLNVNTAGPGELKTGLGITTEEAEAILAYRKKNGNFKDLEALRKVPGVDQKKLDLKKDSLSF